MNLYDRAKISILKLRWSRYADQLLRAEAFGSFLGLAHSHHFDYDRNGRYLNAHED